jgi:hypothetical protein
MKKSLLSALYLCLMFTALNAQDEGTAVAQTRFENPNSVYFSGGLSLTFGDNVGDYSKGINFEAGYLKRLNKVLSIGPSLSYIKFKYDPETTNAEGGAYYGSGDINLTYTSAFGTTWNEKYGLSESYDYAYVLTLEGGDVTLMSLGFNIKLNFVPVGDDTKFSVYGFAKPFVTYAKRDAVTGNGVLYIYEAYEDFGGAGELDDLLFYDQGDDTWYANGYEEDWGPDGFPALKEDTKVTGGIFIGPGVEFTPNKSLSIFAQAAFGYTFPVSFVSTGSYDDSIDSYVDPEFPIVEGGFPSLNFQFGLSFNF